MTHLEFRKDIMHKGKTDVYDVVSNHDGCELGEIRWYGSWRQYVLIPFSDMTYSPYLWSHDCLRECADFIEGLMKARKEAKGR